MMLSETWIQIRFCTQTPCFKLPFYTHLMRNAVITFTKKDGQLVPASEKEMGKLKLFSMSIKDKETVEVYMSVSTPNNKTLPQLARIHAMLRELSGFTGHTLDEIKDEVKRKAGLYTVTGTRPEDVEFKSFADCSKDELSKAIETCIQIGHLLGHDIY